MMNRHTISSFVKSPFARVLGAGAIAALLVTFASTRADAGQSAIPFPDESPDPNETPPAAQAPDKTGPGTAASGEAAETTSERANADPEEFARFGDKGGTVLTGETDLSGGATHDEKM